MQSGRGAVELTVHTALSGDAVALTAPVALSVTFPGEPEMLTAEAPVAIGFAVTVTVTGGGQTAAGSVGMAAGTD